MNATELIAEQFPNRNTMSEMQKLIERIVKAKGEKAKTAAIVDAFKYVEEQMAEAGMITQPWEKRRVREKESRNAAKTTDPIWDSRNQDWE